MNQSIRMNSVDADSNFSAIPVALRVRGDQRTLRINPFANFAKST